MAPGIHLLTEEMYSPFSTMTLMSDRLDDVDEIQQIVTPCKGGNPFDAAQQADEDQGSSSNKKESSFHLTPLGTWSENHHRPELDSSYEEFQIRRPRKPFGRFHSFDTKRSLFSSKRFAADDIDDISPSTKRTCDHNRSFEEQFGSISIKFSPLAEAQSSVISAVDRLTSEEDLIADGTTPYCLPTVPGKHPDLRCITPQTLASVLRGDYSDKIESCTVIDCRYPYEYEGGHIQTALNKYTRESIHEFLYKMVPHTENNKRQVLVFHCEFSSERGPKLLRFLRSQDRDLNKNNYPHLNYPEIYLLQGGYKAFFETEKDLCEPMGYTPMLHKDYTADLRHFRIKSKSWAAGEKTSHLSRTSLRF